MARVLSIFFDVEDPFGELADDAALDLARLCSDLGIRGSFCITGEKCRVLRKRDRMDVVESMQPHALGFHTNTHSVHPTTMELLEGKDWNTGCAAIYEQERPGVDAFQDLFGRNPACWGGAGFTWGPQVAGTLERLEIPAYVYSRTFVPGGMPHRFVGRLAMPHHGFILEEELESRLRTRLAYARIRLQFSTTSSPWLGLFAGHPTRLRYVDFWDAPYAGGVNPDPYKPIEAKPEARYQACLDNLSWLIHKLKAEFQIIGIDDAVRLPWHTKQVEREMLPKMTEQTLKRLDKARRWPIHRPTLSIAEISSLTIANLSAVEIANLGSDQLTKIVY